MKKYNFNPTTLWPNFRLLVAGLSLLFSTALMGQVTISGTVIDSQEDFGLPGVNISVKDQSVGTITDFDGKYNISTEVGNTLVFSYTGYAIQEIIVEEGQTTLDVSLAPATELLDEVVVIGYGAVVKKDLTGVVTKVGEEDFNKGVIASPDKLLVGKVAGLQIFSNGEPGGGSKLRLRGGTGLNSDDSQPLIVVDGVPLDNKSFASGRNPLNFINAADVADITVLKDASAAAIYGSRGANGVIIVTTKTGKAGKLKVNYSGYYSISSFLQEANVFDAAQYRDAINAKAPQKITALGDANTNWVDEVTQNAAGFQHNVSMSGGSKKINYYLSLSHLANDGVLKTSRNQSSNAALNLGTKLLKDNLIINLQSKVGAIRDQFAPNVMGAALTFDPTQPVLDADSEFGGYFQWPNILAVKNPVATLMQTDESGKTLRALNAINFELKMPFLEGLSWKTNLSYDYVAGSKIRLKDPLLREGANFDNGGSLFEEELTNVTSLLETYGTYRTNLQKGNGKLDFTLGYSWQNFDQENRWTEGLALEADNSDIGFKATKEIKPDSFLVENRLISFFGRANYNYKEKYLLTLSLRRDGSTRFGNANKWGLFPAAAFGWRILEEDFAAGLNNTFTNLKLRVSWGVTGNENIGDYLYATFYSYGTSDATYQFGDEFVSTLRGVGVDPDIKWEGTASFNVGVDFGILNNRLSGTLDLYQKNTNDLLATVATAAFTNLNDRIVTNIGAIENKGIELGLDGYIIDKDKLDWKLGVNVAYNQNTITKLDNSDLSVESDFLGYETGGISGDIGQTIQIQRVGVPVFSFLTYRHLLDAEGNPLPDKDNNEDGLTNLDDIYEDVNNDGIVNEQDLVTDRKGTPDWIFGLTSNLSYGNFDLSLTLRSTIGNYVYNNVASSTGYFDRLSDLVTNNIDRSAFKSNFKEKQLKSDYYIENASFLKLDNVSLGYTIPELGFVKNIRLYATAQNILTITGYSGLDPEAPQFSDGIDNNIYPVSATFLFGLNASF